MEKDENLLTAFNKVMPLLKDILQEDMEVALADTEKIIAFYPGEKINNNPTIGKELSSKQPLYKAIHEDRIIRQTVPKEVYGIPFLSIVYPIKNLQNQIIGAVGIGRSLERQNYIEEISGELSSALDESYEGIQMISDGSQQLSLSVGNIIESVKNSENSILKTDNIIKMLQNIAQKSNMLGINAAIEASRAGEAGNVFTVIAEEIRNMASVANRSAKKIEDELHDIRVSVSTVMKNIEEIGIVCDNQTASTEEMTSVSEEITVKSKSLADISKV